jgi:hypothetical protein
VSKDINARKGWAMAQRIGMRIAALPIEARETALAGTERCLREAGAELGVGVELLDSIVNSQMGAIRHVVADIDASVSSQRRIAELERLK